MVTIMGTMGTLIIQTRLGVGGSVLVVQSRHLVDRISDESIWLRSPDFADVFVWREAV